MAFFDLVNTGTLTSYEILNLPNSKLKVKRTGEYSSSCPSCHGENRFIYWSSRGYYWCRQCELRGFVADTPQPKPVTLQGIINSKITSATPEFIKWTEYFSWYFDCEEAQNYWKLALGSEFEKAVFYFGLGWCPDYKGLGPTAVIPIAYNNKVYAVKHRFLNKTGEKYTIEPAGIGKMIFNLDEILSAKRVIITEGEKKAMRLWLEGYVATSSTVGAEGWSSQWDIFLVGKKIITIFDPDAAGQKAAEAIGKRMKTENILLLGKVDDLINQGLDIRGVLGEPWMER